MGILRLIGKNTARNRRRSALTVASVAISITLLAIFCAVYRYFQSPLMPPSFHLLLMVTPRTSLMIPLPLSYGERIRRLPGIVDLSPINMVDTVYGPRDDLVFALACDAATYLRVYPSWHLPPEQREAFIREKGAMIASKSTAAKYGWKLGDRITLRSGGYHVTLDLVLRGIYTSEEDDSLLAFHWDYLNEVLGRPNKPGGFWVRARSAEDVPRLMRAIDAEFRNSDIETRTQPMAQWVLDMVGMIGNVKAILLGISAAVLFAVLLILANSMGMSIRERTAELAVMRALGFRLSQVLGMLAAESLAITLAGTVLGCACAWLLLELTAGYRIGGAMPIYIRLDAVTVALAFAFSVMLSLASTLAPAYFAARTSIAQALRFVG
ncbi:MAG: FtsX-like permease family protein [Acidobacteriia bacterium]|nr:FtsX-like permease family protein [Terriglobia bacterium]